MPAHPVHPDREELAAWQAGEVAEPARARVAAHLAGCAKCATVVSAVERGRSALASLPEPELPPGLHERIAATLQRESATLQREPATTRAAGREVARNGDRVILQRRARRRRVATLSAAAAALVLLVVGLVPLLRHVSGSAGTQQGAGGATATASRSERVPGAAAPEASTSRLPVFQAPGGYSGTALREAVASDPAVRDAYARAGAAALSASRSSGSAGASTAAPDAAQEDSRFTGKASSAAGVDQQACLAQVRAQSSQAVRPAFLVETVYRGRPATVLVTRFADAPGQAELWAFPRGDCSTPPFARERVQIPPP